MGSDLTSAVFNISMARLPFLDLPVVMGHRRGSFTHLDSR
jgi:hypothetical protein